MSSSTPRVATGPKCSMPSRAAPPSARHDGVRGVVVELAVVADVRDRVPVRRGLRTHAERVVARREVAGVAGERDVDRVRAQLGVRALGHVHVVPLRPGLVERERERERAALARAAATPRSTASGVMRFSVPRWSSAPQRPQFETRAANCSRSAVSGMGGTLACRRASASAPVGVVAMPAETDPHQRTLMAWPPDVPQCIFTPDQLEPAAGGVRGDRARDRRVRAGDARRRGPTTCASADRALVGDAAEIVAVADRRRVVPRRRARSACARPTARVTRCTSGSTRGATSRPHAADAVGGRRGRPATRSRRARSADRARRRLDRGRRPRRARHDRALPAQPQPQPRPAAGPSIEATLRDVPGRRPRRVARRRDRRGRRHRRARRQRRRVHRRRARCWSRAATTPANPNAGDRGRQRRAACAPPASTSSRCPCSPTPTTPGNVVPVPYVNLYAGNGFVAVPVSGHRVRRRGVPR